MTHEEAVGYAHILVLILLFVLEVSVVVVERSSDNRHVRHLLERRLFRKIVRWLMAGTLAVIVILLFVSSNQPVAEPPPLQLSPAIARYNESPFNVRAPNGSAEQPRVGDERGRVQHRGSLPRAHQQPLWVSDRPAGGMKFTDGKSNRPARRDVSAFERLRLLFPSSTPSGVRYLGLLLIVLLGVAWFSMVGSDPLAVVADQVRDSLLASWKSKRILTERDVSDLIALGERGDAGHEKDVILHKIAEVAFTVGTGSRYDGSELEPLLRGVERIVTSRHGDVSRDNVLFAADILSRCRFNLEQRKMCDVPDFSALIGSLCTIGEFAAATAGLPNSVVLACIEAAPEALVVPFRIGRSALENNRFGVTLPVLNHLQASTDDEGPSTELLGFSALMCRKGETATETVSRLNDHWSPSVIRRAAERAVREYQLRGDFLAADSVRAFEQGMKAPTIFVVS